MATPLVRHAKYSSVHSLAENSQEISMSKKNNPFHVRAETKLIKITVELRAIFKRGADDVIQVGRLLLQAKKEVGHGRFLPWLESEFSLSEKTAQRYMAAHKFWVDVVAPLLKSAKLTDLRLHLSALYELVEAWASGTLDGHQITQSDLEAILNEATKNWVGSERLREILKSRHPDEAASESTSEVEPGEVAAAKVTGEAMTGEPTGMVATEPVGEVTGEPTKHDASDTATSTEVAAEASGDAENRQSTETPLEAAPEAKAAQPPKDADNLAAFTANIFNLKRLATGCAQKYVGTAVQAADLETVAEFVRLVADLKRQQSAEASISAEASAEARKAYYAEAEAA
jgi:hypothetical protein